VVSPTSRTRYDEFVVVIVVSSFAYFVCARYEERSRRHFAYFALATSVPSRWRAKLIVSIAG